MNGKSKCKILKDIRKQIAQDNDIEFVTSECKYQGDCTGTCPKCEAELQYLENELRKRQTAGKAIAVAGIAATRRLGAVGCSVLTQKGAPQELDGDIAMPTTSSSTTETEPLMGEEDVTEPTSDELQGEPIYPSDDELQGDIPLPTEPTGDSFFDGEPGVEEGGNWGGIF